MAGMYGRWSATMSWPLPVTDEGGRKKRCGSSEAVRPDADGPVRELPRTQTTLDGDSGGSTASLVSGMGSGRPSV